MVMNISEADVKKIDHVLAKHKGESNLLIQVLLELQKELHWLPKEGLIRISQELSVPLRQVYHAVTFYKGFSLVPKGKYTVTVCMGTACHVRGSPRILDRVERTLSINPGETTADLKFSLETVNCLGCCAMGPVMVVGDTYHGRLSVDQVEWILDRCD
jgi:NADH-quinone oxidoreductase subunit E